MRMKSFARRVAVGAGLMVSCAAVTADASIVVHTSDFIPNVQRTHFNGFENMPVTLNGFYNGNMAQPYTEDTIQVQQINWNNPIWAAAKLNQPFNFTGLSGLIWYPNGGDRAYTEITLSGGQSFSEVGLNFSHGWSDNNGSIFYELLLANQVVLTGNSPLTLQSANYIGFSGGGFDTIRMRDGSNGTSVTDGSLQALAIDGIETRGSSVLPPPPAEVPEPASIALMVTALLALFGFGARRRQAEV